MYTVSFLWIEVRSKGEKVGPISVLTTPTERIFATLQRPNRWCSIHTHRVQRKTVLHVKRYLQEVTILQVPLQMGLDLSFRNIFAIGLSFNRGTNNYEKIFRGELYYILIKRKQVHFWQIWLQGQKFFAHLIVP